MLCRRLVFHAFRRQSLLVGWTGADLLQHAPDIRSESHGLLQIPVPVGDDRHQNVADRAGEAAAQYRDQFEDLAEQAEDYVRDNPFRAVGITFAAGVVLGLLLRRR